MNFFKQYPFVRIAIPFVAGIIFRYHFFIAQSWLLVFVGIAVLTFIVCYPIHFGFRMQFLKGIVFNLWVFSVGLFITGDSLKNNQIHVNSGDKVWFASRFLEIPVENEKGFKAEIQVEAQQIGSAWKSQEVKMIAYFEKDSIIGSALAGQPFMFVAKMAEQQQVANPFGFDYQRYLRLKQVEATVYLKSSDWYLVESKPKGITSVAMNLRKRLIDVFQSAGLQGDELSVVSALTLGYKDHMEARIRDAYTAAGVVHVLAVSGAHVAIVFAALSFLLKGLPGNSKKSRLKYLILIGGLWGYALLTGLSPSVCRATTMFSFVLIGSFFRKRANIYNSMAASACFLLFINPLWIFDIGFQLSYLAVLGIVFFYPKIYGWLYLKNTILDYVWSLTAVSLAAQLITTPITLYYFHVFPTYFWLSNIVVVAGATLLIYLAALLLFTANIPVLFGALGFLVKKLMFLINGFVLWITELPLSQIGNIPMSGVSLFLLVLFLGTFTAWLLNKKYSYLVATLSVILCLLVVQRYLTFFQGDKTVICVYQLPKQSAIQFVDGEKSWWFTSIDAEEEAMKKFITEANLYWKTTNNSYYRVDSAPQLIERGAFYYQSGYWSLRNCKGVMLQNQQELLFSQQDSLTFDLGIITGKPLFTKNDISKQIQVNQWVADASLPHWKRNEWNGNSGDSLFITSVHGAFIKIIP